MLKSFHRQCIFLVFIFMMSLLVPSGAVYAYDGVKSVEVDYSGLKITVDGKTIITNDAEGNAVYPFIVSGRTYLPVRAVASALSCRVVWNDASSTVGLYSGGGEPVQGVPKTRIGTAVISAVYRDIKVTVDGRQVDFGQDEPFILSNTVYVPFRAVAATLGCTVGYDAASSTVQVTTPKDEVAAGNSAVTPVPTAAPTPIPNRPKNYYDGYFSNSVFVGDSVMEGFAQYVRAERKNGVSVLSDAQFLTTTIGMKVADIVGDTGDRRVFYSYKGGEKPLETILAEMGVTRAFIMLGMNDMAEGYTVDETISRYQRMLEIFAAANPDIEIVVLTTTPKTATDWLPSYTTNRNFGSRLLNELAHSLLTLCHDSGVKVIDVNAVVRDADGNLPDYYSRDDFVHISDACSAVVLEALRKFAGEQETY